MRAPGPHDYVIEAYNVHVWRPDRAYHGEHRRVFCRTRVAAAVLGLWWSIWYDRVTISGGPPQLPRATLRP